MYLPAVKFGLLLAILTSATMGVESNDCVSEKEMTEKTAKVKAEMKMRVDQLYSQLYNWQNGAISILKDQCSSSKTAGCAGGDCRGGDLRLVGGSDRSEGTVEICYLGHFITVCPENWSHREAEIICRQLNFNSSNYMAVDGNRFGQPPSPPLYHLTCDDNETNLAACSYIIRQCDTIDSAAGVICQVPRAEGSNIIAIVVPAAVSLFLILVLLTVIVCIILVIVKKSKGKFNFTTTDTVDTADAPVFTNEVYEDMHPDS